MPDPTTSDPLADEMERIRAQVAKLTSERDDARRDYAEAHELWARRDLAAWEKLEARAAAAEAAVQRVRELVDDADLMESGGGQQVARWIRDALAGRDSGSAGQLAPTSVSAIVNAASDDQPVTITGYIQYVAACHNQAGAPYVKLTLADRSAEIEDADPDTVTVVVEPAVYAAMDLALWPRVGTLVEVTGRAVCEVRVIAAEVREMPVVAERDREDGAS
jgi:hypothetical protein